MSAAIRIEGLRKEYRRLRGGTTTAVDGLDLEVPEGGVFGFLGPNGAGKTTTIRCLVGLVAPGAGHVSMLGADIPRGLPDVIRHVGSIVEMPRCSRASPDAGTSRSGPHRRDRPPAVDDVLSAWDW